MVKKFEKREMVRTKSLRIRVTEFELEKIKSIAEKQKMTVSELLRSHALEKDTKR